MKPDEPKATGLELLRKPFPENQISKLPKESRAQADERKGNRAAGVNCKVCGGWHHKNAVHLDYVGHAALTDRLLDTDPAWSWEPASLDSSGLPMFDKAGGLWIKLTVCGVTRLGYGHAEGKSGGDAIKEIIGDALRNAAMRFGAALELWHKGELHAEADSDSDATPAPEKRATDAGRQSYPVAEFTANFPRWQAAIEAGRTPEQIIAMVETKGALTDAQKSAIRECAAKENTTEEKS